MAMIDTSFFYLHCFITLAQQLNYTKASQILSISQSALSRIIRGLEQELGYELFYRDTRNVRLTDAGRVFYQKIKKSMLEINQLIKECEEISHGVMGVLKVGFSPYTYSHIMPDIIDLYRNTYPDISLNLITGEEIDVATALYRGEIDVAMLSDWGLLYPETYVRDVLYEDDYCAAVSVKHPLANQENVMLEDLKDEKIILLDYDERLSGEGDGNINRPLEWCVEHGFFPNVTHTASVKTLTGLPFMIACNEGVGFLAKHMEDFFLHAKDQVKFLPINNVDFKFRAVAVYEKGNTNPCVDEFIYVVKRILEKKRI